MTISAADFSGLFYSRCSESSGINSVQKSIVYLAGVFMTLSVLSLPLNAQDWQWPEKPQNIQVLSKELTGRLRTERVIMICYR